MSEVKEAPPVERTELGQYPRGTSGNPVGRPKGSKNKITILKQSLEVALREQAADHMEAVLEKAIELALEGDRQMIKLLLDAHISKGVSDDAKASEKVAIQINQTGPAEIKTIEDITDGRSETDE